MATRIHLFGASGCGATTRGAVLGERLDVPHLEADDLSLIHISRAERLVPGNLPPP